MGVMEDEHINWDVCQRMCSFKVSLQVKEGTVSMTRLGEIFSFRF